MQCEHRHARRDRRDDEVFVQRVAFPEDGDVEKHDRQEFAALGEDEGDVVDMGQGGVAEGGGEGRREGHEEERREDGAGGKDGRRRGPARGSKEEVDVPCEEGEGGLDREEEDGELETLGRGERAVRRRCEFFLEIGPC